MAVSQTSRILLGTGIFFVILPYSNMGLLSDYKICGDSACQSLMSRAQAIRDHQGKDCRYLSFRRGDTIFVYHKLTRKREDLWAGSIDKQFGYFPKDAVTEEQIYASKENIMETQESDFFCMDESGYPIDSSHLDNDDEDDQTVQTQEPETTQTSPFLEDDKTESSSTSEEVSTESPCLVKEQDVTQKEGKTDDGDSPGGTQEEADEATAAPNEKGGSASSAWLGSSVTGWLGLAKEEEHANLAEEEKNNVKLETQAEGPFLTASMTGWLGMAGGGKTDDDDAETVASESFASTMTGWLGFQEDKTTEKRQEKEKEGERDTEPGETFRSRRMSLDLEGSQLHEEEKKEIGTLDWLGNGLSSSLGFGRNSQESETTEREVEEAITDKEQSASSSWYDIGIGNILGYREQESDENTESGFKDTEGDGSLDQPSGSEIVNTNQPQPELRKEAWTDTTNESKVEFAIQDAPSEIRTEPDNVGDNADSNATNLNAQDSSKDSVLPKGADADASGGLRLVLDSTSQIGNNGEEEENKVFEDEKKQQNFVDSHRPAEKEVRDNQMPKLLNNDREEKVSTTKETDAGSLTQSNTISGHDLTSVDSSLVVDIQNQINDTADTSIKIDARIKEYEGKGDKVETGAVDTHISPSQTTESIESQVTSDARDTRGESHAPIIGEANTLTPIANNADQDSVSQYKKESESQPSENAQQQTESLTIIEKDGESNIQLSQAQTAEFGVKDKGDVVSDVNSETETDTKEEEELKEQREEDELKTEEKLEGELKEAEVMKSLEKLKEAAEELQNEVTELKEDEIEQDFNKMKESEVKVELEEPKEEKMQEMVAVKEEGSQEELEQSNEDEKQGDDKESQEEEINNEMKEIQEGQVGVLKKEETLQGLEETKEDEKKLELEANQEELRESREDVKQGDQEESNELKEGKSQERTVEAVNLEGNHEELGHSKKEEKQGEGEEFKEKEIKKNEDEMSDLKEQEMQQELQEIKKGRDMVELDEVEREKEEGNEEELGRSKKEEKPGCEKELKGGAIVEEKHQQTEELKEENQKDNEQTEELDEVEDGKELEKKEGDEEQVRTLSFEVVMGNTERPERESNEKHGQDENSTEASTQTEVRWSEQPGMDQEQKEKENQQTMQIKEEKGELKEKKTVEEERRDSEDAFLTYQGQHDANRLRSIAEGAIETEKQNQDEPFEGMERDNDRQQKEGERKNDTEADKLKEGSDDAQSNNADGASDLNAFELNQTEDTEHTNNDLLMLPNQVLVDQMAEYEADIQQHSDGVLYQRDTTRPQDSQLCSNGISAEVKAEQTNIDQKQVPNREETEITVKQDNVANLAQNPSNLVVDETETKENEEGEVLSTEPLKIQAMIAEPTIPQHPVGSSLFSDSHINNKGETESDGTFGFFSNPFRFFSQAPTTQTKDTTESAPGLNSDTGETPNSHSAPTPEPEGETNLDSNVVYIEDLPSDDLITPSQHSPSPMLTDQSHPRTMSPNKESPLQTKTFSKHHQNLLTHLSADETAILIDLCGQHKVKFLDDILGSSESMTGDPDTDESILMDVERLLHYHRDSLLAPSVRLEDAPQEEKERTRKLIALQKFELLLARVRDTVGKGQSDINSTNHQVESSCVGESCRDKELANENESHLVGDSSVGLEIKSPKDNWMGVDKEKDEQLHGDTEKEGKSEDEKGQREINDKERLSHESRSHVQPPQSLEGVMKVTVNFVGRITEDLLPDVHAARELLIWFTVQVVSALPDDIRPGPDLYGVPWEPVIVSSLLGLVTVLLFTCRCYSSVKSRMYRSKERWMAEQVAQLLDEKCKVLETLSICQQEYDDLETSLRDSGVLAQTQKTEQLEVQARQLESSKKELERDLGQLKDQLEQQTECRKEQERRIDALEESMKSAEEETKDLQSQEEQAQTTLKVYHMNSERLQKNLETAGEENTLLQESNSQLRQQVEGWAERVSELQAEMSRYEATHSTMLQDVSNKDERIWSLTDRLLRMKAWDSDLEEDGDEKEKETSNGTASRGEENGKGETMDTQGHLQKVQKLIYAAKLNADLKSVDEDKDRAFAKLNDEVRAKEELQVGIKELEHEKLSLQSDTEQYRDQVQRLQQKLNIMTEMYQENELKLHRLLTVEEKDRMQKEERLNKADKNIALAIEELNNYRQRAQEMEEELEKSKQSYQTQISAHEKKAHNNWLAARAAERELSDIRRENGLFRQKLTDTQFKLDALDKDPYALDSLARPMPFRAERSPYGPSPLGRPASETRAFLSPPTLMDGPPNRLSPRVPRGVVEPPGGQGEMERSGGPHSDSGSISPTWERDRRGPPPGPPGPPGYMYHEPGGPMYRRPLPPPGPLGLFPPPGSLPPGPLPPGPLPPMVLPPGPYPPADVAGGSFRENSFRPGEQENVESGPGDRRTPPEADPRMGGPPPPGPPMGPMDGPFPRRAPYGAPPPDFYPPRGPGGPPMRPMWAAPPPGMMFPPRFPPGGPPLPHHPPHMRPPFPDSLPPPSMGPLPPRQSFASQPPSESPEEHTPSPEDAI